MPLDTILLIAAGLFLGLLILRRGGPPISGPATVSAAPSQDALTAATELRRRLASTRRTAFDPVVKAEETAGPVSKFGGVPWLAQGVVWPTCKGCNTHMHFFAQLDVASLPAEIGARGEGLIQVFMCTNHEEDDCLNSYDHYSTASVVRLLGTSDGGANADEASDREAWPAMLVTSWTPLVDYPHFEDQELAGVERTPEFGALEKLTDEAEITPTAWYGDKVGGWPSWAQGSEYGTCHECGKRMTFILQVDSEDNVPFMFGDAGVAHLCQCPDHPHVLTWGWACG